MNIKYPDWCINNEDNMQEYPESKVKEGWRPDEIPPCEWENYFKNLVSKWIRKLDNLVPIGGVVPTFPGLSSDCYHCTATTKADNNGFVLCNGQIIDDPESTFNGKKIPNLNDNRFVKGTKDLADVGKEGGDNILDLDHKHKINHIHKIADENIDIKQTNGIEFAFHTNTNSAKDNQKMNDYIKFSEHNTTLQSDGSPSLFFGMPDIQDEKQSIFTSGISGYNIDGSFADSAMSGGADFEKKQIDLAPANISAVYVMRIA